ncbi:MAG: putative rane transporter protein YfcA [Bacteroidota bacterium]|jgi:uncharacterized membrane protein YfcA
MFDQIDSITLLFLCTAAFGAGFVDAIVGGGGLIQTPTALVLMPNLPVATVIGSLKIPAFSGTFFAAKQYVKKVKIDWKQMTLMCTVAFSFAFLGSELLSKMGNTHMKPILFCVLIVVAIYTYTKKGFGQSQSKKLSSNAHLLRSLLLSATVGFYDGFIGPGTGSFLVLGFIALLGYDFLQASAHAKMVNLSTNFGSIVLFFIKGTIIWGVAIPMAICNAFGGLLGAKLAIAKGNQFIRVFFLLVICATILRFGYDVFFK